MISGMNTVFITEKNNDNLHKAIVEIANDILEIAIEMDTIRKNNGNSQ